LIEILKKIISKFGIFDFDSKKYQNTVFISTTLNFRPSTILELNFEFCKIIVNFCLIHKRGKETKCASEYLISILNIWRIIFILKKYSFFKLVKSPLKFF